MLSINIGILWHFLDVSWRVTQNEDKPENSFKVIYTLALKHHPPKDANETELVSTAFLRQQNESVILD